ncbi:MAG: DUF3307 domain-containing protein [Alteromonadaceae bacterium]|nr:DUF3307 domain-containing protein [Alteromonadaceae bacterium]
MNEPIQLLAFLFLAHILGDFYFQPSSWVRDRNEKHLKSARLYQHVLVHGILVFIVLCCGGYSVSLALYGSLFILITHLFIDFVKSYLPQTFIYFFIDQILHIIILGLMWGCLTNKYDDVIRYLVLKLDYKFIVVVIAYVIVLKPTAIIIRILLEQWSEIARGSSNNNENGDERDIAIQEDDRKSLVSAGKVIGMVERLLILTFVLLNQFSGVGFLLAAKSVFRFGDLKDKHDHKMTEYVMLGTLLSLTITMAVGIFTLLIIKGSLVIK